MHNYRQIVARNVRSARLALKLSQEAFAHECKVDRTYISGIERGLRNPSLDMIVKIALKLNLTPGMLFDTAASKAPVNQQDHKPPTAS
ncbi:Helix-turn-helix [Rhizobium sp. NFR03]|nr:helix-turn-helix transcriptional regulator [Rhizobium sp. NFR03]SES41347.1 Helix-turn-helix [Rhizobium sp. NFR03]